MRRTKPNVIPLDKHEAVRRLFVLALAFVLCFALVSPLSEWLGALVPDETMRRLVQSGLYTLFLFGISTYVYTYVSCGGVSAAWLGLSKPRFPKRLFGLPFGIVFLLGLLLLVLSLWSSAQLNRLAIEHMGGSFGAHLRAMSRTAAEAEQLILTDKSAGTILLRISVVVLLAAFCEELFMRGALQPLLIGITGTIHAGILITALLFALLHGAPDKLLPIWIWGLAFGYLKQFSGSIVPGMALHLCNNLLTIVLFN